MKYKFNINGAIINDEGGIHVTKMHHTKADGETHSEGGAHVEAGEGDCKALRL